MNNQMKKESNEIRKQNLKSFYLLLVSDDHSSDALEEGFRQVGSDKMRAIQMLLWSCDKSGLGKDGSFKALLKTICESKQIHTGIRLKIVKSLEHLNKWSLIVNMLKYNLNSKTRIFIFSEIEKALSKGNVVCAKNLPRNGEIANRIRGYMKLSPIQWRKILVPLCSNQTEVLMSSNRWSDIDYSKIPTNVLVTYYLAFKRHDKDRFLEYLGNNPARSITIKRIMKNTIKPRQILTFEEVLGLNYFQSRIKSTKE